MLPDILSLITFSPHCFILHCNISVAVLQLLYKTFILTLRTRAWSHICSIFKRRSQLVCFIEKQSHVHWGTMLGVVTKGRGAHPVAGLPGSPQAFSLFSHL